MARPVIHKSITEERLVEAGHQRMYGPGTPTPGFCMLCGNRQDGCEPDAEAYECESCGERAVFSPEEILIAGKYYPRESAEIHEFQTNEA